MTFDGPLQFCDSMKKQQSLHILNATCILSPGGLESVPSPLTDVTASPVELSLHYVYGTENNI